MQRIEIIAQHSGTAELEEIAHFYLAPLHPTPEGARFSDDEKALFVPRLELRDAAARKIANGGTLFNAFRGVSLRIKSYHYSNTIEMEMYHALPWSYVWGDFQLFESGASLVKNAIFLAGVIRDIDLAVVGKYVKEMTERPKTSDQAPIS